MANYGAHNVSILLNDGDGTFTTEGVYAAGRFPTCVALKDVDGDEDADMAVTSAEPDTVSVYLNQSPHVFGDIDGDGDVDSDDFALFAGCMSGPGTVHPMNCQDADLDEDVDVDVTDFAEFQRLFTGALP